MALKVTILGSGTMMPTKTRHPSGYLVESDTTKLLLDCGHTTFARLVDLDVNLFDISGICITHFHADHFSDLLPILDAMWIADPQPGPQKESNLTVIGPVGIRERWDKLRSIFWVELKEVYNFRLEESKGSMRLKIGDLTIQTFSVKHVPWFSSLCYRVTDKNGKTLAYTGDAASDQAGSQITECIKNADLLLAESGTTKSPSSHLTPQMAVKLARNGGVKKVVLTHVRDKDIPVLNEVIAQSNGLALLAEDNLIIDV